MRSKNKDKKFVVVSSPLKSVLSYEQAVLILSSKSIMYGHNEPLAGEALRLAHLLGQIKIGDVAISNLGHVKRVSHIHKVGTVYRGF